MKWTLASQSFYISHTLPILIGDYNPLKTLGVGIDPFGKGKKERQAAVAYFEKYFAATLGKKDKTPKFTAYKDKTIALALNSLFHGKCAYCESRFVGIHPVDIEHWRPKGDVYQNEETLRTYGYYWLAASWENLLPSCIDCNRVRTHKDFVTNQETTLGKGNYFPLTDENKRGKVPGDEDEEGPLLINPCIDEPSQYLEFQDTGCVSPKTLHWQGPNCYDRRVFSRLR